MGVPTAIPKTRKIVDLLANGEQPWGPLDAITYENLAYEIKANDGKLIVPVVLSARGRLIDGHHRLMIAQEHGRKTISENEWVVDSKATDAETEAVAAIKYQQNRRQTTTADNARVTRDLMRRFAWSQGIVAQKLGVSAAAVSQWLKAHPDPTFEVTSRIGADGKTYTVEAADPAPPKARQIREHPKQGAAVLAETRKYREQITNPELAEWMTTFADPDDHGDLLLSWRAIADAASTIADAFDSPDTGAADPFDGEK